MKNLFILFLVTSVILLAGCSYSVENAVICIQLYPVLVGEHALKYADVESEPTIKLLTRKIRKGWET